MTEYLILSLNRAVPLVWEYNREITFDVTFSRSYGNLPKSSLMRKTSTSTYSGTRLNSTSMRGLRVFGTPPQPAPNGVVAVSKPRLHKIVITVANWTGNPQFRFDLHYANSDYTLGQYITSFTPSVVTQSISVRSLYVDFGDPPAAFTSGFELDWDKLYAIVLVPTSADSSNYADLIGASLDSGSDTLIVSKWGYSTNGGSTWTINDGDLWSYYLGNVTVAYAWYYIAADVTVPVAKSSEAFRSYFNGWTSRTTLPSAIVRMDADRINGVTNPSAGTEVPFSDAYTYSFGRFYTTADVAAFTQTDVASIKWKYDINPITIDKFYASEAYLQKIEFLDTTVTNRVRLNDSYEQEFSGSGGTSLAFDPPVLWWKAEVLSGRVRMTALVFE